ncbi:MAG: asparagine--tRNA ligase [Candidatus Bathyarchaeota archaeon]|nr:asparagine--tRNA ligase [Candidatus Bathyarchaeota archaeon]
MSRFVDIAGVLDGGHDGEQVAIRGWMYNRRSSGGIQFLTMRDGTGAMQCTLNRGSVDEETFNRVERLPMESALELGGVVRVDERAPNGRELSVNNVGDVIESQPDFPITRKRHGVEFLLDNRHLYLRSPRIQAILRLRAKFMEAARDWFREGGYTEIQSPSFITAACEGGSTLFNVDYFEREGVYLSQSWQLYAESMISSLGKIFTIAPSFRAETSRTRRHLSEFWHLEVEEPWTDLEGIMEVGDELVTHICHALAGEMPRELRQVGRDPEEMLSLEVPFPRISYDEAIETLQGLGVEILWGDDFGWQQLEPLSRKFDLPFWIVGFPTVAKPFYHKPDPGRPEVTLSADLIAPEGYDEIIGGGQRIHDYDELMKRIHDDNLDPADYSWYLDLRRWGTVPHSGFGLGIERVLMWICKLDHIRDTIPFPRDMRRVFP